MRSSKEIFDKFIRILTIVALFFAICISLDYILTSIRSSSINIDRIVLCILFIIISVYVIMRYADKRAAKKIASFNPSSYIYKLNYNEFHTLLFNTFQEILILVLTDDVVNLKKFSSQPELYKQIMANALVKSVSHFAIERKAIENVYGIGYIEKEFGHYFLLLKATGKLPSLISQYMR